MRPPPVTRQPPAEFVVVVVVVVGVVTRTMWRWWHCPLGSQPAVVQGSLSVSGHGVLFGFGVLLQAPVSWVHTESTHTVDGQLQSGIELDCWPPDVSPL